MLQPRRRSLLSLLIVTFIITPVVTDVTTVLLVDNHGRSSLGRFLSVKPAVGLLTSTARTFIQEGVTTEYATQVLGTTLDNGRLYAHLLTKSSRVLYDNDLPSPTRSYHHDGNKKWNLDNNNAIINNNNHGRFIKNTDYIAPHKADAFLVFPTTKPRFVEKEKKFEKEVASNEASEEEILNSASSSNARVPYEEPFFRQKHSFSTSSSSSSSSSSNNVKVFKINPIERHINLENYSLSAENDVENHNRKPKQQKYELLQPSKIQPDINVPTFTVRNDFSPSGYSFLGDLPEFQSEVNTERNKPTTPFERKAKLLFKGGQPVRQELKNLETVTYFGFADFTTIVGDTVIIFSPHTKSESSYGSGQVTSIQGDATLIEPSRTAQEPTVTSTIRTFMSHDPGMKTQTVTGHKFKMQTSLPTMVIDASNRQRAPKTDEESEEEKLESLDAKLAVLAHEQNTNKYETTTSEEELEPSVVENDEDQLETITTPDLLPVTEPELTAVFSPDLIEPSETSQSTVMLSTPSDEEVAKIFASLAALARQASESASSKQATEPLITTQTTDVINNAPTQAVESETEAESETKVLGGATTIFFEDDFGLFPTQTFETTTTNLPEVIKIPTTTEQEVTTENLPITQEQSSSTTTEKEPTTLNEILTTNEEILTTQGLEETTPELNNEITLPETITENDIQISCSDGKIVPTTAYKTLTYLTTFFIPVDTTTTTSVKSNVVVSTDIGFRTEQCTPVQQDTTPNPTQVVQQTTEQSITKAEVTTEQETTTPIETTTEELTTELKHVTEFDLTETTTDGEGEEEEIELIFKTLYTTYTYLTTFFQESTSSISSRKVVITNVITSTLDPGSQASDPAVAGLFAREDSLVVQGSEYKSKPASFEDIPDIAPSQTNKITPTLLPQEGFNTISTPALPDENLIQPSNAIKTYYTTYTYFTTIFVDGETEISSRTEVYTNYVTPIGGIQATETLPNFQTKINELSKDQIETPDPDRQLLLKVTPIKSYNSTISRQKTASEVYEKDSIDNNIVATVKPELEPSYSYTTLHRSKVIGNEPTQALDDKIFNLNEYETISTMVTDVRSSSSQGERRVIDNVDKRNVLDDQIVAESNNDSEIIPSPTLLLQTSFTTFTYFTTMYSGTTSSNVVSRLETITNVVTETLTPTQTVSVEDETLPVTYFTTFTYWTTLYKDGSTTVTSREDTVSNVVTPTGVITGSEVTSPVVIPISTQSESKSIVPTSTIAAEDELTTFFTTYTYFTTSYLGNSTVLNSRLETVTNVVNNTQQDPHTARAINAATQNALPKDEKNKATPTAPLLFPTGLLSTTVSSEVQSGTTTLYSTEVYGTYIDGLYAKVLESTTKILSDTITPSSVTPVLPTGIISLNQGKIVDAEGVSTLFYTTQAIGTYIDNLYAQVIESTSSLSVNEERKSALPTDLDPVAVAHRTGLVRLIEGSIVQNKTTTIYQSKVLGTVIDGRYAQIIESTSSFIVEKTTSPSATISPSATKSPGQISATATPVSPSPVVIEGSLNEDATKRDEENTTEDDDDDDDNDDGAEDEDSDEENGGNSRVKSRLTFSTKKRTFTPAIRPFASRNRPTFNPKRKGAGANGPTTITRSDFTPTITATPALKSDSTRGRFSGNRRQSSGVSVASATPSGSRRFSRPKATTSSGVAASSTFSPSRGRSSSGRIQPTVSGSRRGGGFRSSSALGGRASSNLFASNSRFRIRPTLSSALPRGLNTLTTPSSESTDDGNDLTTVVTDESTDFIDDDSETTLSISTTTESAFRRNPNPLLRFRRPPLQRSNVSPTTPRTASTPKKNGNLRKTTTTTPKPKGRAPFARPVASNQNKPRSGNGLFPRRDLFKPRTPPPEEPKEEEIGDEEDILTGDDLDTEDEEDVEYEGSDTNTHTEKVPVGKQNRQSRAYSPVQVRPFLRGRTKRQTTYSRFRRPNGLKTTSSTTQEPTTETSKPRTSKISRFRPRSATTTAQSPTPKRISPSRVTSNQGRSQFTLREKDSTSRSSFKRPSNSQTRRTTSKPSSGSRPKAPRLRTTTLKNEESSYRNSNRNSNRRSSTRRNPTQRYSDQQLDNNFVLPTFDGTITITHQIPTEATIPVVNGKITEYKNIITAKFSTEVLVPQQYTTRIGNDGREVKVLLSESTNVAGNGATEITQFVLKETPTTSVVFTPTYIRGRRTSFSHVIPSTVYGVEQVVSTIQPQLAAQAPLANILLSQLLLGNLGVPQPNPLLAIQNPGNVPAPSPTTEFKTRTTTYVTTVTDATSTVIPLTFRGKEILTTIVDSSTNVITATEFITDTVVVTPTATLANNNQLNSLLLPLLLQQQQQPTTPLIQQKQLDIPSGLQLDQPQQILLQENIENDLQQQSDELKEIDAEPPLEDSTPSTSSRRKGSRKKNRSYKPTEPTPPIETSVVTLYVSGKRPGEFSTVLSTVVIGEEGRKKREIPYVPVHPSRILPVTVASSEYFDRYVMPAMGEVIIETSEIQSPTESLESIIGDVSKYMENHTVNSNTVYVRNSVTKQSGQETELSDGLDEYAPLTPKVETSSNTNSRGASSTNTNVSIGNRLQGNRKLIRIKRDTNSSSIHHHLPRRRKIIKKFIRRKPNNNHHQFQNETLHSEPSYSINSFQNKIELNERPNRRRIIVTKKRRINTPNTSSSSSSTSHRRRVVVTKKRLITKSMMIETEMETEMEIESSPMLKTEYLHTTSNSAEILPTPSILTTTETESSSSASLETIFDTNFFILPSYEQESIPEPTAITTTSNRSSITTPTSTVSTTVLTSTLYEYETKTIETTRLRTYTFIVTRVNGAEQMVTSTTEVKPQVKTLTVTDSHTKTTTVTLTLGPNSSSVTSSSSSSSMKASSDGSLHQIFTNMEEIEGRRFNAEEARYNLATRVMSNGVEVIVAGDKTTLPGDPNFRRIVSTSSNTKPITLAPSTLSDHMMMLLPQDASEVAHLSSSLYQNQFVTKTCLTTYTYLTTYLENGSTTISSHEQVVSNIATEEKNSAKITITPTGSAGITLTQNPNLATGVFHTTYTYLYTILDDDQPLVITSKHTVANTVTAPDDYLSLLQPSESATAIHDTNTYLSTVSLTKTLTDGLEEKIVSTEDVLTQVVITESVPPKGTSVMTSYIALDVLDEISPTVTRDYTTTDVVKTYFVTYTYYNTFLEDGRTVVKTNVSTSSDVVTEKLYLHPRRTQTMKNVIVTTPINSLPSKPDVPFEIYATKTYLTTYTYFTTFLQDTNQNNLKSPIVSSNTKIVENVVTETVAASVLDPNLINNLEHSLRESNLQTIVTKAILNENGEELEVTAEIKPTKSVHIQMESSSASPLIRTSAPKLEPSSPSIITGSTIIFFDENDQIDNLITPSLSSTKSTTLIKNKLELLLSSEIVNKDQSVAEQLIIYATSILPSKIKAPLSSTLHSNIKKNSTEKPVTNKKKVPVHKHVKPTTNNNNVQVPDILNFGTLGNSLNALGPVFNAMAGLIQTNLQGTRRQDNVTTTPIPPLQYRNPITSSAAQNGDIHNRGPIYIPVAGFTEDGLESAESQNVAAFDFNLPPQLGPSDGKWVNEELKYKNKVVIGRPTHESPLLNGGIPISPGQVITANSDVIVGKPAILGPRIPFKQQNEEEEVPLGMKPPPLPSPTRNWVQPPNVPVRLEHFTNEDQKISPAEIGTPIQIQIEPSQAVIFAQNPPFSLPEVIERSTGQPLLINIQPSQVANVVIPPGSKTALLFGGTSEPHKNGQYFDEPSPYPEPERNPSYNNNHGSGSQYAYVGTANEKPVSGVINVDSHVINHNVDVNVPPLSFGLSKSENPSKPIAPISFGMVNHGEDFNAHIINHGHHHHHHHVHNAQLKPTLMSYEKPISFNIPNYHVHPHHAHNKDHLVVPNGIVLDATPNHQKRPYAHHHHHNRPVYLEKFIPPRAPVPTRPRPVIPLEFMKPPPALKPQQIHTESYPKPLTIPLNYENNLNLNLNQNPDVSMFKPDDYSGEDFVDVDDESKEYENEDGEVIQESKTRPLRPGQIPYEILKINSSTTTKKPYLNIIHVTPSNKFNTTRPSRPNQEDFINKLTNLHNYHQQTYLLRNKTKQPFGGSGQFRPTKPNIYKPPARTTPYYKVVTNPHFSTSMPIENVKKSSSIASYPSFIGFQPHPTSMPVDSKDVTTTFSQIHGSQTEKPFTTTKPIFVNKIMEQIVTTERISTLKKIDDGLIVVLRNKSEEVVNLKNSTINGLDVLMKPPKVISSTLKPQLQYTPFEEMYPPPPPRVVGLSPPPLTHTPPDIPISTYRPVFTTKKPYTFETPTTTTGTTTRKIYTTPKERTTKFTSLTSVTDATTKPIFRWTKPVIITTDRIKEFITNNTTIRPRVTTVKKPKVPVPSLEVIIGNPTNLSVPVEKEQNRNNNNLYEPSKIKELTSSVNTESIAATPSLTEPEPEIYNTLLHHGGNEVKIVDDVKNPTVKESRTILPTKYITHTQTLTVTTTKTTVIKSVGAPPSTLTLQVTKTQTSTIVDTVTATETLVQPTSIVETVTTTISHTPTKPLHAEVIPTIIHEGVNDLNDFIITDNSDKNESILNIKPDENESIFVVMTDTKLNPIKTPEVKIDDGGEDEHPQRDEMLTNNDVNRVLLGGILIASPPSLETPDSIAPGESNECRPDCKASRNELCQKIEGVMRCVCRPGFARMFPDRPCKPTYTYRMKIALSRYGKEVLRYKEALADPTSPQYTRLAVATHEGLDRMVMQSDLRDIYHGVQVNGFERNKDDGIINNFYVQLSENTDETRLKEVFKKYLRNSNYSIGGTEIYAAKEFVEELNASDFDECTNVQFHDCSEHAQCFNLKGTYTCSCKEGYSDLSENPLYPGRICSAELIGCELCHYHGTCYSRGSERVLCECFQWYTGEHCHINLKILLIALITLGGILLILLLVCILMTCSKRRRPKNVRLSNGISFLPHRPVIGNRRARTLDRRAMIQDTSSEGSDTLPYVPKKTKKLKGALKKPTTNDSENEASFIEQRDRSLTVMIPRAKYHPAPPTSPLLNYTPFDKRKNSIASSNEAKLLSYLDAGPCPSRRKHSNTPSDSCGVMKTGRKISSGALVSAGFEVSATVGTTNLGTLGTIATTCGSTEADRSENATLIQKISADLLSSTGTQSQFTTLRKLTDVDEDPIENWLDITPRIMTVVSEARSYAETTIQAPTKSLRSCGRDSKPSSSQHHNNDEANTMAERDLGSTFLLPHTHLYKPDRGSDISGFDSL